MEETAGLTRIINAAGTYTPLGVSRSPVEVRDAVADILGRFVVIDELQAAAGRALRSATGAAAATVTHCAAAGITLAVAAAMTGEDAEAIARLPDTRGLANRVVIPASHVVNYGHSILTAIRLAGATPVVAGSDSDCSPAELRSALWQPGVACLLLVSSRLTTGAPIDMTAAVALAHEHDIPVIIDGAAQDMRMAELLATGAELVVVSAHKYLAAPTAGLILGDTALVRSCRAQERGIGRAMKATKEALAGVLAALEARRRIDWDEWRVVQARQLDDFIARLNGIAGPTRAYALPDPTGLPFSRVALDFAGTSEPGRVAEEVAAELRRWEPSVRVMEHEIAAGRLVFELVPLTRNELEIVVAALEHALHAGAGSRKA